MADFVEQGSAGQIQVFTGASTDTKPKSASVGSICIESDTSNMYMWNGAAWVLSGANAAPAMSMRFGGSPLGFDKVTLNASTANSLPTIPAGATACLMQVEDVTNDARMRDDGVDPTATIGYLIYKGAGNDLAYAGDLSQVRLIATAGTPTVNVLFY